jgi:streptogramin lyase
LKAAGYIPDSVVESADGAVWFSAARIEHCSGNVSCQTEELGTIRSGALAEKSLGATQIFATYGAAPGPGPSIWVTNALRASRVFDLSGKQIATVRFGGNNGSGALSPPFIGPDGRMWFAEGSFGQGGGGVVAVDANYTIVSVASCKACFFAGGVTAADGNAWLLDPYLGGFYRVTPQGALTRFDFGTSVLQTMIAGPGGALWGTANGDVAEYDLMGNLLATFTPPLGVQSGLQTIGENLMWANFGPAASGNELDLVTMTPHGAATIRRFKNVGSCASEQQWFSNGPALGGDGALYVGIGCSPQSIPFTARGHGFLVRIAR